MLNIYDNTKYYPAAVALEVTLRCNMRCLHCGSRADTRARKDELTLNEWKDVVDQLRTLGCEFVTLSGGEPFVWEYWRELSTHIARSGCALSIISNGFNITEDDVRFLKENNIKNIGLSVDGTREIHDRIRQVPGAFDRVMRSITHFKKEGVKVGVSTSVNKLNFKELNKIKKIMNESGIDVWQVQVVNSFGRAGEQKETLVIDQRQYKELVEFIHTAQEERRSGKIKVKTMPADSIGYCHSCAIDVWDDLEWGGCNAGRYVLGIQSNGDVSGCLSLQDPSFIAGNIRKKSLNDIWADDNAFHYTRKFSTDKLCGSCSKCSAGEQCKSGCLGMGYSYTGELYHNPYCYKHIVENIL